MSEIITKCPPDSFLMMLRMLHISREIATRNYAHATDTHLKNSIDYGQSMCISLQFLWQFNFSTFRLNWLTFSNTNAHVSFRRRNLQFETGLNLVKTVFSWKIPYSPRRCHSSNFEFQPFKGLSYINIHGPTVDQSIGLASWCSQRI